MEYIVSARKYRPVSFDTVVGQSSLTTTLRNAVKSGKLAHAYLFCGPRGVGKTTCARIFAKAINCMNPTAGGEACNQCESCRAFDEKRSYNIFELDAASNNSVENIKSLMEQTRIPPQVGKYKVFIIDEVHMLSTAAFNSFLKTLEEPPAHVIFILATTEKHKILPTILSRCQIYDFERMSVADIIGHLKDVAAKEGIAYEDEALNVIAEKADGGMRDALSIFDQCASFSQGNITFEKVLEDLNVLDVDNYFKVVDLALQNKVPEVMLLLNGALSKGFDGGLFVNGLASHLRNVLMAKDASTLSLLDVSMQQRQRYADQSARCPAKFVYAALKILNACDIHYRQSSNKRLLVELTLIEVAQLTQEDDTPSSGRSPIRRLKALFSILKTGTLSPKAPQAADRDNQPVNRAEPVTPFAGIDNRPVAAMASQSKASGKQSPISVNGLFGTFGKLQARKAVQKEETVEVTNQGEEDTFSQPDLEREWLKMCARMPEAMKGLAMRMKNIRPRITRFPNVELIVDNENLRDQIVPIKNRIRATIAQSLHNAAITFDIRLAEKDEIEKVLTKRELFDLIRQENPAIEELRTKLGLELT
ncbi:MAG: DNA polymerase III subunit gamma/tau [Prevotella sp.]|nr:DNA polymerase III subunit gamma/tau [Prevotella sp.]